MLMVDELNREARAAFESNGPGYRQAGLYRQPRACQFRSLTPPGPFGGCGHVGLVNPSPRRYLGR